MSTKNFVSNGDAETLFTGIGNKLSTLKSGLTNLDSEVNGDSTTYPYADIITIEDAVPANLADCSVKIEPVQDLHGQSAPYVGGAGKNKCILLLDRIKAENTAETWNGNVYVRNGVTITVQTDNDGNVTGIKLYGVCTSDFTFYLFTNESITFDTDTIINGRAGAQGVTLRVNTDAVTDTSTGATIPANTEITRVDARIRVTSSGTAIDATLYPMIRLATETDATFAPYTNICPISGHTEASVQRDGKNLLDIPDKTLSSSGWAIAQASPISVDAGTYTLTYDFSGTANSSTLVFYDENNVEIARGNSNSTINGRNTNKVVLPQKAYYFNMYSNAVGTYTNFMFESGEDATPYVPYSGKTYTILFKDAQGQTITVYGSDLEVKNGTLKVNRALIEYDGSEDETWAFTDAEHVAYIAVSTPAKYGQTPIANWLKGRYTVSYRSLSNGEFAFSIDGGYANYMNMRVTSIDNLASWKTYLASNPLQVCYELATPLTIQLTPQQIQLLQGQNTLTASTGQISVTVNGVSGAIGAVQEQANATDEALAELAADIAEQLPTAPTTDGAYVLTVTVADGTPTYSWESAT